METIRHPESDTPEVVTFAEARLTDGVLGVREDYLERHGARSSTTSARWTDTSKPRV